MAVHSSRSTLKVEPSSYADLMDVMTLGTRKYTQTSQVHLLAGFLSYEEIRVVFCFSMVMIREG